MSAFTIDKTLFDEPIAVCSHRTVNWVTQGIAYVFKMVGEIPPEDIIVCQMERRLVTFTDSAPSTVCHQLRDLSRMWNRVDVTLKCQTNLTDHLVMIAQSIDQEDLLDEAPWVTSYGSPVLRADYIPPYTPTYCSHDVERVAKGWFE